MSTKPEFVVVGVDVKNAGRGIEVNAVSTVFGRRDNASLPKNEEVIYKSKEITPEQQALLERPNSAQYPAGRELSEDKDSDKSADGQGVGGKVGKASGQGGTASGKGRIEEENRKGRGTGDRSIQAGAPDSSHIDAQGNPVVIKESKSEKKAYKAKLQEALHKEHEEWLKKHEEEIQWGLKLGKPISGESRIPLDKETRFNVNDSERGLDYKFKMGMRRQGYDTDLLQVLEKQAGGGMILYRGIYPHGRVDAIIAPNGSSLYRIYDKNGLLLHEDFDSQSIDTAEELSQLIVLPGGGFVSPAGFDKEKFMKGAGISSMDELSAKLGMDTNAPGILISEEGSRGVNGTEDKTLEGNPRDEMEVLRDREKYLDRALTKGTDEEREAYGDYASASKDFREAAERYGSVEAIPESEREQLEAAARKQAEITHGIYEELWAIRNRIIRLEQQREDERKKEEQRRKEEENASLYHGFLKGKSNFQSSSIKKHLSKVYDIGGKVQTLGEFIEGLVFSGEIELEVLEENKLKGASRSAWNRMSAYEQQKEQERVAQGGKKKVYLADGYEIGKTGYDYAVYLLDSKNDIEGGQILALSTNDNAAANTIDESLASSGNEDNDKSSASQGLSVSEGWAKQAKAIQKRIHELQEKVDKLRREIEARIGFTEEERQAKLKEFDDLLEQGRPLQVGDPRLEPISKKINFLQNLLNNWHERKEAAIQKELEKTEEYKALRKAQDDWGKIPGVKGTSVEDMMTAYDYGRKGYYAFIGNHPEAIQRAYYQGLNDREANADNTQAVKAFAEKYQQERQKIARTANDLAAKLGGNVEIVTDEKQIPDTEKGRKARTAIEAGIPVKGWYDVATGKAYVYLPNAESEADVEQTVLHEVVAHKGLRGLLGQRKFDELCDKVWASLPLGERKRMLEYVTGREFNSEEEVDAADVEKRRAAADEWLAYFAEDARIESPTLWQKAVSLIRKAIRSLGINLRLSDDDIFALLRRSYAKLQQGETDTAGGRAGARLKEGSTTTAEERSIEEKAKANGTWMKAPNGKPTNLSERQWLQVRTKAFKDWFGDWEKAARIAKLRKSEPVSVEYKDEYELNRESAKEWLKGNVRDEYTNEDTGEKIEVSRVGINEVTSHGSQDEAHLKSLVAIPRMLKESIFIDEIPNAKDHDKYDSYRYYVCGLKIDEQDYTAKIVVGVKGDKKYYDHRLTQIEKGALIDNLNGLSNSVAENQNADVSIGKDTRLHELLQADASKVVDENGEPLVVYHGSMSDFWTFDKRKIHKNNRNIRGFFFSPTLKVAEFFSGHGDGYIKPVFLNVRNPLVEIRGIGHKSLIEEAIENGTINKYDGTIAKADEEMMSNPYLHIKRDNDILEIVVPTPSQIKSATDNTGTFSSGNTDIRFRLRKPVEESGNLIALHNLSADNLKKAFGLGGFPMPSIAVTKADVGHAEFGDISLIFGKESIDPTDRRNKVYGEDAWTPRFPETGYKLDEERTRDIYRRARAAGSLPLLNPADFHQDNYERFLDGTGSESLVKHFKNDYGAKQLYLYETGNPVEKMERHEGKKYLPEQIGTFEEVLNEIGLERLLNSRGDILEEDVKKILSENHGMDFGSMKPFQAKARVANTISGAVDYAVNGNLKTENDIEATKRNIDGRINQKDFEKWLEGLFDGIVEKRGIRNDKDRFTPSGNSRKWEHLYDELTLDNVVKAMQKQAARGGQGLFGGSIFGAAQEEYKSIDEIRQAARERIRTMSGEEAKAGRKAITDRLSAIEIPGAGNRFPDIMDMVQNIQDAVAQSHTAEGVYKYLKNIYPEMTTEAANEIADIVKDIQRMSARYFEAKPYRAVGFDEVRAAIVPDNAEKAVVEGLEERGVPVRKYKAGDEEGRKEAVNGAAEALGIRFRIGESRKRQMRQQLTTKLTNASAEQIEATISEIEKLGELSKHGGDSKVEKAAAHWAVKGTVILPEDNGKILQAMGIVNAKKLDFMKYDSPMEIVNEFSDFSPKEKAIDPDTVPTLRNKRTLQNGITIYEVEESEESRRNMREIINTHFGKDCSPWCLLQGDGNGELTKESARYWKHYNAYPKRVVFKDGRLVAFSANDNSKVVYWDRQDRPHEQIPYPGKVPGDELGRSGTILYDPETGAIEKVTDLHKGNTRNGLYEEWHDNGQLKKRSNWKDGKRNGLTEAWHDNGQLKERSNWKDGKLDGLHEAWHNNGQLWVRSNYKDGKRDGLHEEWYDNGQPMERSLYENDNFVRFLPLDETGSEVRFRIGGPSSGKTLTRKEKALRDAIVGRLRASGIEVVTDSEAGQRVLDEVNERGERVRMQAMLGNLTRAANTIRGWMKNGNRGKVFSIELPKRTQRMVRKAMGRDFASHNITANGIAHALKNHGEKGKKLNERSIPIREKDAELIPYIMTAPDYVRKGSTDMTGRESVRFYKDLSNGYVVVVEKEYKDSPDDMETINMWAELSSSNVSDARTKARPLNSTSQPANEYRKTNAGTVIISSDDAAKIRKDAEAAILADGKVREQRVSHGSGADFDHFDFSYMGTGEGAQAFGYGGYGSQVDGISIGYAKARRQIPDDIEDIVASKMEEWDSNQENNTIDIDERTREHFGINEPIHLWDKYEIGDADETELAKEAAAYYDREIDLNNDEDIESIIDELLGDMDDYFQYEYSQRREEYEQQVREQLYPYVYLYTLEIPDDNGSNYLHWEKPVIEAQIKKIQAYLDKNYRRNKLDDFNASIAPVEASNADEVNAWSRRGANIYKTLSHLLGGDKAASEALSEMGFTGISYPAQYRSGGRPDGARNFVIFKESDMKITGEVKFFRTPKGEAYGFTLGGKIYLDPRVAMADTPIHEYAHLWSSALREANPEEWANVAGLMKDTPVWEEVKKLYPELKTDEEIADEVLAMYSGKRGAERLLAKMRELEEAGGRFAGQRLALEAMGRVREALRRFWHAVADFLHIRYTTAEEVADRVLSDLLEGVNPRSFIGKRSTGTLDEVNARFNEGLGQLTEANADEVILDLGNPSDALLSAGIPDRGIALYGNKLVKKAKEHGYSLSDVRDLPMHMQNPIAVFRGSYENGFAILTELDIDGNKTLVTLDVVKGEVQDLNLVTSLYGKAGEGIINWINKGKLLWADKAKASNYLSSSAPIADATSNPRLSDATKIVETFENPKLPEAGTSGKVLFRKWYGGNRGYVGYSMSRRAAEAREEGRFPKTDFKKEYHVSEHALKALVRTGFIDGSEWHHTSKYGNRTPFYGWTDEASAQTYLDNKKEVDALSKEYDGLDMASPDNNAGLFLDERMSSMRKERGYGMDFLTDGEKAERSRRLDEIGIADFGMNEAERARINAASKAVIDEYRDLSVRRILEIEAEIQGMDEYKNRVEEEGRKEARRKEIEGRLEEIFGQQETDPGVSSPENAEIRFRKGSGRGESGAEGLRRLGEALGVRVEFYPSGEGSGLLDGSQIRYDAASGTVRVPSGAGGWEAERRILDAVVLQEGLGKVFGAEYDRMLSELQGSLSALPGMEEAAGLGKAGEAGSREKLEAYLAKVSEVGTEPEAWDIICKGVSSMLERKGLDYPVHETEVMGLLYADAHRKGKSLFYGEEAHHARIVEAFEERAGLARDMASDLLDEIRFRRAEGKPSSGGKSFPGDKLMGALSEMPLREETKRVRLGRLEADVMEWLADEGFRLKLLTDHIRSIGKWRVTDETDLYKLSTLVPGKVQYQRDKFRHDIGKPLEMTLRSILDKTGLKVNDVELYLMAKHMPERSEWMFSRAVIERMIESGVAYVNRSLGMLESISKEERQKMAGRLADSVKSHEELSGMEPYALYCKNRVSSLYERERARKQGESWDSEYRCHICNAGPLMDF